MFLEHLFEFDFEILFHHVIACIDVLANVTEHVFQLGVHFAVNGRDFLEYFLLLIVDLSDASAPLTVFHRVDVGKRSWQKSMNVHSVSLGETLAQEPLPEEDLQVSEV